MLLTKIVEVVSHEPFAQFMNDRIFAPLGMSHTKIDDDTTEIIPHRATGYASRSDPRVIRELASVDIDIKPGGGWVRLVRVSPHFGGSGVFTTLNDQHMTVICLSNMPLGDAEGKADALLGLLHRWGKL